MHLKKWNTIWLRSSCIGCFILKIALILFAVPVTSCSVQLDAASVKSRLRCVRGRCWDTPQSGLTNSCGFSTDVPGVILVLVFSFFPVKPFWNWKNCRKESWKKQELKGREEREKCHVRRWVRYKVGESKWSRAIVSQRETEKTHLWWLPAMSASLFFSTQSEYSGGGGAGHGCGRWPRSYYTDLTCRGHHRPGAVWSKTEHLKAMAIPDTDRGQNNYR